MQTTPSQDATWNPNHQDLHQAVEEANGEVNPLSDTHIRTHPQDQSQKDQEIEIKLPQATSQT